ncbi:hypothetical protein TrLO_g10681, partial [Triparma laevis f. longispina]
PIKFADAGKSSAASKEEKDLGHDIDLVGDMGVDQQTRAPNSPAGVENVPRLVQKEAEIPEEVYISVNLNEDARGLLEQLIGMETNMLGGASAFKEELVKLGIVQPLLGPSIRAAREKFKSNMSKETKDVFRRILETRKCLPAVISPPVKAEETVGVGGQAEEEGTRVERVKVLESGGGFGSPAATPAAPIARNSKILSANSPMSETVSKPLVEKSKSATAYPEPVVPAPVSAPSPASTPLKCSGENSGKGSTASELPALSVALSPGSNFRVHSYESAGMSPAASESGTMITKESSDVINMVFSRIKLLEEELRVSEQHEEKVGNLSKKLEEEDKKMKEMKTAGKKQSRGLNDIINYMIMGSKGSKENEDLVDEEDLAAEEIIIEVVKEIEKIIIEEVEKLIIGGDETAATTTTRTFTVLTQENYNSLTVLSWNVYFGTKSESFARELKLWMDIEEADVLCLQEVNTVTLSLIKKEFTLEKGYIVQAHHEGLLETASKKGMRNIIIAINRNGLNLDWKKIKNPTCPNDEIMYATMSHFMHKDPSVDVSILESLMNTHKDTIIAANCDLMVLDRIYQEFRGGPDAVPTTEYVEYEPQQMKETLKNAAALHDFKKFSYPPGFVHATVEGGRNICICSVHTPGANKQQTKQELDWLFEEKDDQGVDQGVKRWMRGEEGRGKEPHITILIGDFNWQILNTSDEARRKSSSVDGEEMGGASLVDLVGKAVGNKFHPCMPLCPTTTVSKADAAWFKVSDSVEVVEAGIRVIQLEKNVDAKIAFHCSDHQPIRFKMDWRWK